MTTRKPLNAEEYSAYVWYKGVISNTMWLSLGIGLCVGIGLTVTVISLTQSWFSWSW